MNARTIKKYFTIDKKPRKGLLTFEWVVMAYLAFTLLIALFAYTKLVNPDAMIWGRMRIVAMTIALWAVYRVWPCRFTIFIRAIAQMGLLAWWYPDTYEINRIIPVLDHVFAAMDEHLFGFQPALLFAEAVPYPIVSELMNMGYFFYFALLAIVPFHYFFLRYEDFERCVFIILGGFMTFFVVFDFVSVVGPTYYYKAIGLQQIAQGVFPAVGDYFNTHADCLPMPGYDKGFFYGLVEAVKSDGERPTAAFPSSHVGMTVVCMLLLWRNGLHKSFYSLLPICLFLCMATVYIQAHYFVDTIAGLLAGVILYYGWLIISNQIKVFKPHGRKRKR